MKRYVMGAALAAVLAVTAGCDRLNEAGKLAGDALSQLTGGKQDAGVLVMTDDQVLAAASIDDRALFGAMSAPVELKPINIDELLQTQRFFAVGSVIAMPKAQIVEPVLEPETFEMSRATADEPSTAALNTEDAPLPESLAVAAGPPVAEAPPPPPAATAAPETSRVTKDGAPSFQKPGANLPRPTIKLPTAGELRQQAQITAPKALKEAVRDKGFTFDKEQLRSARKSAEDAIKSTTQTAQAVGDDVARKATADIPKALQVRSRLSVDAAINARDKAGRQLEALGLSGIVTPGEGGQMRITIGVNPTQFREGKLSLDKVETMRSLFAPQKQKASEECSGVPDMARIKADPVLATECVVKVLQQSGEYEYVEKDFIFNNQMMKKPTQQPVTNVAGKPNDPLFSLQWNFRTNGAATGQSAGGAGFSDFWVKTKDLGSRDVIVAVVDTGIQMNHPDIKGSPNLAPGFDMVSDPIMGHDGDGRDSDPNDPGDKCDPNDATVGDSFHGTHVAGTIGVAATNNKAGVAGGAWNVTIVPVRALGRCGGKLSDINDGIRWAAGTVPARDSAGKEVWNSKPADIINLSIGLFGPCPASMQAAINDAVAAGAIVVSAAGNARVDTQYFAPGGCQNVISVAANDARGVLTPYSNFGANVSIMAPGGDMSRDDDHDGRPDGILSTKYSTNCTDPVNPSQKIAQCYYSYENGTSMAAPHVSAALALLKTKFPSAVPSELKTRLMTATTPRTNMQCSGQCSAYPGSTPIPGSADMCYRPCGGKMLNLSNAQLQ
ncbi:MAG: S8 family serine peptidase [Hyphomonadaceae bacterium]